jgi:hypothetical protein
MKHTTINNIMREIASTISALELIATSETDLAKNPEDKSHWLGHQHGLNQAYRKIAAKLEQFID